MERTTHKIDAKDKIAGRLASEIAVLLQGKNRVDYQAHTDCGEIVEVTNVAGMKFSGKKLETKVYHRNTGYPSGIRTKKVKDMMEEEPQAVLRKMVYLMLPKNRLRPNMIKRLKVS
ncbi:MAG: 50S ribosomal protein L13 [Candidatus Komeilibacteria bacterium]|nr:50S ribosomal protein L13 [Candidatus Komeilibacteria bacterium]